MAASRLVWRGPAVKADLQRRLMVGSKAGADLVVGAIKADLSTPFPPASSPGQTAHMRTGGLRGSIGAQKAGPLAWRIGSFGLEGQVAGLLGANRKIIANGVKLARPLLGRVIVRGR